MALPFDKAAPLPGALTVSGDGRLAAHIGENGDIFVWDPYELKSIKVIPEDGAKPSAIALSPDGETVAIGYFDSRLVIRSVPENKPLREFFGHSGGIFAISFSLDGRLLASGGEDATTQLWDVDTGKRLRIFDSMFNGDISSGSGIPVWIGFSGDGGALVVNEWYDGFYDVSRGISMWDIKDGIELSTRDVAPPGKGYAMRAGSAFGAKGWLLVYTGWIAGKAGLMVERLDQCDPPRQLPFGGFADTVLADPMGRWVVTEEDEVLRFVGLNGDERSHIVSLPSKAISLVSHPKSQTVFALLISDAQRIGERHFVFGRDSEVPARGAIHRISVPAVLEKLRPLDVSKAASHCAPSEAIRLQQDFKLPEKPSKLSVIAKLVPAKEMIDKPDSWGRRVENGYLRELYFTRKQTLFALYQGFGADEVNARTGVVEWNMRTKLPVRSRFVSDANQQEFIIRLADGWGEVTKELTDLLTGKPFSSLSNGNDRTGCLRANIVSDPDTGQIFRLTSNHFERYSADGRRLPDVVAAGTIIDCTVRNGRLAVLKDNGELQVWQLEPEGESKTYKLGLKSDDGVWAEELALSADGRYLQAAFPSASGDGPTEYVTYRIGTGEIAGKGQLLSPFPARANLGVVADYRPHRLAVWDYDKGEIIARLPRHRSRDKSGAYRPLKAVLSDDGRLLASASHDGVLRIWDISTHQLIGEGRAGGEVTAMAFDLEGRRLAVGRRDGQIVAFEVAPQE